MYFAVINYFQRNRVKMFQKFDFRVYSLFKNEILRKTSFIIITDEKILRKWISSTNHAVEALLLAPKLLMPRKSQVLIVGILPNKCSQLDRLSFGMGNPFD